MNLASNPSDSGPNAAGQAPMGQLLWWLLMSGNSLIACVLLFFQMVGTVSGSLSFSNAPYWLLLWTALLGPMAGGVALRRSGRVWLGALLLAIPALPGAVIGAFAIAFFQGGARWQ